MNDYYYVLCEFPDSGKARAVMYGSAKKGKMSRRKIAGGKTEFKIWYDYERDAAILCEGINSGEFSLERVTSYFLDEVKPLEKESKNPYLYPFIRKGERLFFHFRDLFSSFAEKASAGCL